jgi:hypothetical protein
MTDVKDLDFAPGFPDVVINEKWAVRQFSNAGPFPNQSTHARELSQQVDVLDQRTAEAGGSFRVILGNVADDFREIV